MEKNVLELVYELKNKCQNHDLEIMTEYNLSQAEYSFISALDLNEEIKSSVIANKLGLSVSRVSRIIDKLVKNGYLKRKINNNDRRAINLNLTTKGREVKTQIEVFRKECENKLLEQLPKDKIGLIKESLDLIIKHL